MIDATGLQMLHRLNANLQQAGITMNICDLKGTLQPRLQEAGLLDTLSGRNFISADRAMKFFEQLAIEEREVQIEESVGKDL